MNTMSQPNAVHVTVNSVSPSDLETAYSAQNRGELCTPKIDGNRGPATSALAIEDMRFDELLVIVAPNGMRIPPATNTTLFNQSPQGYLRFWAVVNLRPVVESNQKLHCRTTQQQIREMCTGEKDLAAVYAECQKKAGSNTSAKGSKKKNNPSKTSRASAGSAATSTAQEPVNPGTLEPLVQEVLIKEYAIVQSAAKEIRGEDSMSHALLRALAPARCRVNKPSHVYGDKLTFNRFLNPNDVLCMVSQRIIEWCEPGVYTRAGLLGPR